MCNFKVGQLVCLKSNTSKKGAIVSITDEDIISVFIDNEIQPFYESQLIDINSKVQFSQTYSDFVDFHNYMTAIEVGKASRSSLFSLNSGKIDFIPYQYRPVLKFIKSDQPRILIADSVGVGKTIEAELILKEYEARKDIDSIAIICPKPLISEKKWENELKRFGEEFIPLNGSDLKYCLEETNSSGEWPRRFRKCIIPYSLFDEELLTGKKKGTRIARQGLLTLDPAPHFDLLIVDEAHHIKNTSTSRYKVVDFFSQHSDAAIFLTATPIELGSRDLFVLLNSLRPDVFVDFSTFQKMAEPNQFINNAAGVIRRKEDNWQLKALEFLSSAKNTFWGKESFEDNPDFIEVEEKLKESEVNEEERVRLITTIEGLNTFSNIINRTRRRDIGNFTIRKSQTVRTTFSQSQENFYNHLLDIERKVMQICHGPNVEFMMNMIQRQCSSCIFGMIPLLKQILSRNISAILEAYCEADEQTINEIITSVKEFFIELQQEAESLTPDDNKFEALLKTIKDKQTMENNKIIIFSTFRHTLAYLLKKLQSEGLRVDVIHGDVPDEDRRALRKRFEMPKEDKNALDILLFSEVGCEGLDYQFCDYMVNYDLPWNPMKVEQRIGRIDRNGQKSEAVVIINMITEGTIEQEIYDRCLKRIGVFESSIGDCEEILGEITQEIENISHSFSLTKEEQAEKLQQMTDNKIRMIQESQKLENEQYNLLGIKINNEDLQKEIKNATNPWLEPEELELLIKTYLKNIGYESFEIEQEKHSYHLRIAKEVKEKLLQDFDKLQLKRSGVNLEWERWLKRGDQYLNISFTTDNSTNNSNSILINVLHPLVKQAAKSIETSDSKYIALKAASSSIASGKYKFIIYQWNYTGVLEDSKLVVISENQDIEDFLNNNIEKLNQYNLDENMNDWDYLNKSHQKKWFAAKEKFIEKSNKVISFKKQSITTNFRNQKLTLEQIINDSTDEKIQIMKKSQLSNATDIYNRKIKELDNDLDCIDITFKPIVYGVLRME